VTVLLSQLAFIGEFALLLAGGILLVRNRPRGRSLALIHALTVIPVFAVGTIAIRIAEGFASLHDAPSRPATWLMAAPFAGIFALLLILLLNRPAVRTWAHRQRLALAGTDPATLPPDQRDALPASELALWSAAIAWMLFPPVLAQLVGFGLGIAGLVVCRRGRHAGRGYAILGIAVPGLVFAIGIAGFVFWLCVRRT
jgi:hypothetical protein